MAVHYFHCTDGVDLIIDRTGQDARSFRDLRLRARAVAERIKQAVPSFQDWRNWSVYVYDAVGEVVVVPFEPEARTTPARG